MSAFSRQTQAASEPEPIRVLLLGPLRLALQAEACAIVFPRGGSQDDFWVALLQRFPALAPSRSAIRLVRNQQFLLPGENLEPGDEIALIPPVSGGTA